MSGCCEKKIIYVGKSENLLSRLIDHLFAMDTLKKNIIERVCEKAHENIYYYMNPYLWHPDVEVVVITLEGIEAEKVKGKKAEKVLEIEEILNNIAEKIDEKLQNGGIKENDLKEALKAILKEALEIEAIKEIIEVMEVIEKGKDQKKVEELRTKVGKQGTKVEKLRKKVEELREEEQQIIKEELKQLIEEELKQIIEEIKEKVKELENKVEEKTTKEIKGKIEELEQNLTVLILKLNVKDVLYFLLKLELTDILEKILISILNPGLNKSKGDILGEVRQLALQSSISEDLKSYLCNYGLKIREMVKFKELLKNLKGFYVIKHKMLPEEFEDTKRAKRFREFTMDIFCEFLKKKERKA